MIVKVYFQHWDTEPVVYASYRCGDKTTSPPNLKKLMVRLPLGCRMWDQHPCMSAIGSNRSLTGKTIADARFRSGRKTNVGRPRRDTQFL